MYFRGKKVLFSGACRRGFQFQGWSLPKPHPLLIDYHALIRGGTHAELEEWARIATTKGLYVKRLKRGHATPIVPVLRCESKVLLIIHIRKMWKICCCDDPVPASSKSHSKLSNGLDSHECTSTCPLSIYKPLIIINFHSVLLTARSMQIFFLWVL